nr:hypothetical protein BaRGS_010222 [Batillaria attramentaria]
MARTELNGFGFSEEECESQKSLMMTKLSALEQDAYRQAGHPFCLTSTDDVAQVLYLELQLPVNGDPSASKPTRTLGPSRRAKGRQKSAFSTSKDILEKLKPYHPLPGVILEWRRISSALTKHVYPLQKEKAWSERLGMHRMFGECQLHTATGRVSMSEPNLQNIPKDFDITMPGGVMVAADYSQLELRVIAHLSGDRKLTSILNDDGDVFKLIAAQWKNTLPEAVTAEQRQQAKQAERQAVNTTVQGSAADIVKAAMNKIDRHLAKIFPDTRHPHRHLDADIGRPCGAFLVLQLHDELIYEVSQGEVTQVARIIQQYMENTTRVGDTLADIETPALVVCLNKLEENIRKMKTVMANYPGVSTPERAVLDAGMKALSLDSGEPVLSQYPDLTYHNGGDEHGVVVPARDLKIGDKVWLVPGHCDPTVNMHSWIVGMRDGRVECVWPISGRGPGV